ncbi:ABC-type multidrug/protein/lipid transport system, ATPase component [Clostridium sp. SY8519]|nr:ABC-type multidrug/protein/lipid transport system, ATPase component [Clostridium sp. SY8519]
MRILYELVTVSRERSRSHWETGKEAERRSASQETCLRQTRRITEGLSRDSKPRVIGCV